MNSLKEKIMRRVKMVYMIRALAFPFSMFLVGFIIIISTVSIYSVFANLITFVKSQTVFGIIPFFISALSETQTVVQIGVTLAVFCGLYSLYKFARFMRESFSAGPLIKVRI